MNYNNIDLTLQPNQIIELELRTGLPGPAGPEGPQGPPGPISAEAVVEHVNDTTPHPAYDDLPSLSLIFENGLV